ncbi:L-ascorbate oxidase [Bradyrhizobium diazoefficiens]
MRLTPFFLSTFVVGRPVTLGSSTFLAGTAFALVGHASAQQGLQRIVTPPPAAQVLRARPATNPLALDAIIAGPPLAIGEAEIELNIDYTDSKIYNPATGQYDAVKLRSYKDAKQTTPGKVPFVAPTIDIAPGETVRLTLHNLLKPTDQNCPAPDGSINTPHCFNRSNLHSHGLWISPAGNSDNVLISINPGVTFQYEYNVPPDHPAGTFWYHPHLHGSTALQVSSGMAGLLIVRGSRTPTPQAPGDIDVLLRESTGTPFPERLVLLQQVQYACRDDSGKIEVDGNGAYTCKAGETGKIEGYDQFGPGSWPKSGRYTSINGEVLPAFPGAQAGRIERWRIAHAGVRDTVKLQFKKMRPGVVYDQLPDAQAQQDWVEANCLGDPLPQFVIASDGLTRRKIAQRQTTVLQPGYREDLLMVFPEAGDYCVIDDQAPANANINADVKSRKLLGSVNVGVGTPPGSDLRTFVTAQLLVATDRNMPLIIRQKIHDDLSNDLHLTSFAPHPDVTDNEIKGHQTADLRIGGTGFGVNGVPYDPKGAPRVLLLGSADEWTLTAGVPGHPFHIHVNPFQIMEIRNSSNVDVSVDGEADDLQYANLKGEWRDTLFVKAGYTVTTRSRYRRYIGDFVLHCHILDHEDQGMMQNVRVGIPDGTGGVANEHH